MGKISRLFGKVNYIIGQGLKVIIPNRWLAAKKPYIKVENEYKVYGLGGYVFGALGRLSNQFLFPGLKEITSIPGGLIEKEFADIPSTTKEGLDMTLRGIAGFEVLGKEGAVTQYENDANLDQALRLVTRYTAARIGEYSEQGIEAQMPNISREVVNYFKKEGKKNLEKFGVGLYNLPLNSSFDQDSQTNRYQRAILDANITETEGIGEANKRRQVARGVYDTTQIKADATEKSMDKYFNTAKKFLIGIGFKKDGKGFAERVYQTAMEYFRIDNYQEMASTGGTIVVGGGYSPQVVPIPTKNNPDLENRV